MPQPIVQQLPNSDSGWSAGYDKDSQELVITFPNGRSYSYSGVPPDIYEGLTKAKSAGKYFNEMIRGVY